MRFLIYFIILLFVSPSLSLARVKPPLAPQPKKTLSLEEKKKEIIKNPDPAIYNDIRDYWSEDDVQDQDQELDKDQVYTNQAPSRLQTDFSSMGSGLKGIMKNHNLTINGVPYSLQGLPIIYTSKSTGFNLGVRASIADMKREQPYIYKFAFQYWISDRGVKNHEVELDIPTFFSRAWHIRLDYKYTTVIDNNYFGIGNDAVFNQNFITPSDPSFISRTYYQYKLTYPSFTFNIERKLFSDTLSIFTGIGLEKATINPYNLDSRSYIDTQKPYGYNGGNTNYIRVGLTFDTRDYPFNPTKGVVLSGTYTDHAKFMDSDYEYKNIDFSYMLFFSFLKYFTLAHRIMIDQIWGDPPFFALAEFKSYESYQGLGGGDLLRGAPSFRFIDNLKIVNQIELRTRFYNGMVFGQHLQINITPFWDVGRVWNRKQKISINDLHNTFGSEFRFTWNANFIMSFTVGVSSEQTSTYLSFGESFD
jgi:hypothetical protein